jgi:hypothetical protein
MGGNPSKARTAMFELCRAVNERQVAMGGVPATFRKGDGTSGVISASEDLAGVKAGGGSSDALHNLKLIRDIILGWVEDEIFLETSGGTPWTKANLETAIGTDLDADPIRPQEARYWQAMQDALDLLIYTKHFVEVDSSSGSPTHSFSDTPVSFDNYVYTPGVLDEREDSWDARTEESGTVPGGMSANTVGWSESAIQWQFATGIPGDFTVDSWYYWHGENLDSSYVFDTSIFDGALVAAEAEYSTIWGPGVTLSEIEVEIDGESVTFSSVLTAQSVAISGATIESDTEIDIVMVTTAPSTRPFSNTISGKRAGIQLVGLWLYLDLSSILTDQA